MTEHIKAIILDMDGTITDNMQFHLPVWERVVIEMGGSLQGEDLFKELYGKNEDIINRIFGENKFTLEESVYWGNYKEALYRELYKGKIVPLPGLTEFLKKAKQSGIKIALGTAGTPENIEFTLRELHIAEYFDVCIGRADVINSKPDPETFLKCAELLSVKPEECIVFEDVPKGVETALRAGMKCIVLKTTHTEYEFDKKENIIQFISDFTELTAFNFA